MSLIHTNSFETVSLKKGQSLELIDIFGVSGKKTIELKAHSSLIYLVVGLGSAIDLHIVTKWPQCSCTIFGLFASDNKHPLTGSLTVSLDHSQTSADVELITFLRDGAKATVDGSILIGNRLDQVHGRLLEHNIVLGKDISIKTLPKLNIASHDVHASHGATIDSLDQQKLFYMMSRGLTKEQSQKLLVDWYIEYVLSRFSDISDKDKKQIRIILS